MTDVVVVPEVETVLREQDEYRASPPAVLPRAARAISLPIDALTSWIIPTEVIEAAMRGADWAASSSIRKSKISHDFSDLTACEAACLDVRQWALGYAVTGGGAAGAFGAVGLAIDLPATVALALRTVRQVGLCYGFDEETEAERIYVLDILQLASANSHSERKEALDRLSKSRAALNKEDWQRIASVAGQTTGTVAATRRVATTLGMNLSTRKMAQLFPIVGAAVGASVNAAFQNDVFAAARFAYRSRWLETHERIVDAG